MLYPACKQSATTAGRRRNLQSLSNGVAQGNTRNEPLEARTSVLHQPDPAKIGRRAMSACRTQRPNRTKPNKMQPCDAAHGCQAHPPDTVT